MDIAGVLVLYKPNIEDVLINVSTFINEISMLYVIDNSGYTRNVEQKLLDNFGKKVSYFAFLENEGIAKALNKGCQLALENGFYWVLTMDQDSKFLNAEYFNIVRGADCQDVAIFSIPQKKDKEALKDLGFYPMDVVITSGNIISLLKWNDINGFKELLFIDEVDIDFCLRCKRSGFKILAVGGFYFDHHIGSVVNGNYLYKRKEIDLHSSIRLYYIFRNVLYTYKEFKHDFYSVVRPRRKYLKIKFKRQVLFSQTPFVDIYFMLLGVFHFVIGKNGKLNIPH